MERRTILVVDDEEMMVDLLEATLTKGGYIVSPHTDPAHALDVFKHIHDDICLVIADLIMPDISGTELAQKMRDIDSRVPFVLITGYPFMPDPHVLLNVRYVMLKPILKDELLRTVESAIGGTCTVP